MADCRPVATVPFLMVEPMEEASPSPCARCKTANPPGTSFCTHCGAPLAGAPAAPASRVRSRRAAAHGDAAEQSRARNEFGRIKNIVLTVRAVFWAETVYALSQVLLWHKLLSTVATEDREHWMTLVTLVFCAQVALMVAGAVSVLRAPLLWTTVGACATTLHVALGFWANEFRFSLGSGIQTFLLVAFWFAVAQAARVQRLMAADPKLQIVRKKIDPRRKVQGGVADEARERQREERRRTFHNRLKLSGVVAVLLIGVIFGIRELTKPPAVDGAVAEFAARWGRAEIGGLADMFVEGAGDRRATALREELERRGWHTAMPPLGEAAIESREDLAHVTWKGNGDAVTTTFQLFPDGWRVVGTSLPPLQVPDLAPALAAFRTAWDAKGTTGLLAMIRDASRERLGGSLQRLLEKRQWHERRPALGDVEPGRPGQGRTKVLFALGNDELEVVFEYWHPSWRIVGVRLPRE